MERLPDGAVTLLVEMGTNALAVLASHRDQNTTTEEVLNGKLEYPQWTAITLGNLSHIICHSENKEEKKKASKLILDYVMWVVPLGEQEKWLQSVRNLLTMVSPQEGEKENSQ